MAGDDVAEFRAVLATARRGRRPDHHHRRGQRRGLRGGQGRLGATRVEFVKVAMQPGMPQGAGRSGSRRVTPIVTLPGNPVSALVSFEVFLRARAARGDGPARGPHRAATCRGADRNADLAAPASGSSAAACCDAAATRSPAMARPRRITCAGSRRRTVCWRSARTSPNWTPDRRCRVWDLRQSRATVESRPDGQTPRDPQQTPQIPTSPVWSSWFVPPFPRFTRPACRSSAARWRVAALGGRNRWVRAAGLAAAGRLRRVLPAPIRGRRRAGPAWWSRRPTDR